MLVYLSLFGLRLPLQLVFSLIALPPTAIDKKTPQEVWSGTPASYSNLKIFGCPTYAHVNNGKLEPRSIKCVFLGCMSGVKRYKLWSPETKKVMVSKNVIFYETVMLHDLSSKDTCDNEQQKSSTQVEFEIGLGYIPESTSHSSSKMKSGDVAPSRPQYSIVKERPRRDIKPPQRYVEANLVAYTLNVAKIY